MINGATSGNLLLKYLLELGPILFGGNEGIIDFYNTYLSSHSTVNHSVDPATGAHTCKQWSYTGIGVQRKE